MKYKRTRAVALKTNPYNSLFRDIFFILLSVFISLWIVRLGVLDNVVTVAAEAKLLATFIAGFFFTSAFTIAPAALILASLAKSVPPFWLALWGASGALCGDLTIFLFVKDHFAADLVEVVKLSKARKFLHYFKKGFFRWLSPLIGAIIIASPLPDELGITMMGLSKTRTTLLIPISFCMNFLAVFLIAHVTYAL